MSGLDELAFRTGQFTKIYQYLDLARQGIPSS